ncbi:uncharacterized protein LOC114972348 [Acropora millepora]|uniref:uncharacterized protein LOC114972348 n=1 Tax=Acropora millepora TaxID=45264 RepID=UPI001CF3A7D4|nr:uncharacterized protein LOC114972348 [Acropora millepora]
MDFVRHQQGNLTPEIDIFSARCVIVELFDEGNSLFDLSEFLSCCSGDFDPSATCSKLRIQIIIRRSSFQSSFMLFLTSTVHEQLCHASSRLGADERISRLLGHYRFPFDILR